MERWNENYPENAEIEGAYDSDLLLMARETGDADFAAACLHDLVWRNNLAWDEEEPLYKTYNRLNAVINGVKKYEYPYELTDEMEDADDADLLKWAEESDTWNGFSLGCLHEIAWRNNLGWNAMNERMEEEDADEAFARIKEEMEKKSV